MDQPIVNRVANSGLITINLEEYYPEHDFASIDLMHYLFQGLILREKEFRETLKAHDWKQYLDKIVLIYCSNDAIIPVWAYMLVTAYVEPFAYDIFQGQERGYLDYYYKNVISSLNLDEYQDQRIIIKGCSGKPVPASAYTVLTHKLLPLARSVMYGEPCSTVPIYKKTKARNP